MSAAIAEQPGAAGRFCSIDRYEACVSTSFCFGGADCTDELQLMEPLSIGSRKPPQNRNGGVTGKPRTRNPLTPLLH